MSSGTATNRTNIDLPVEISREILQKTQEASAIMSLARQIELPGKGANKPVQNWERSTSRLYIVTLLISLICRIHHVKCQVG